MRTRLVVLAGVITFGLLTTACGGGDSEQADTPAAATAAPAADGQAAEDGGDAAAADEPAADEPAADEGGDQDSGGDSGMPDAAGVIAGMTDACGDAYNFFVVTAGVMSGQTNEEIGQFYPAFLESVPGDLRDEAELFAGAYLAFAEAIAEYDGDVAAAAMDPEVMELLETLGGPEVTAASDAMLAYFETECAWAGS